MRDQLWNNAVYRVDRNSETIEIDSRPSDAIALAVKTAVPIYVEEEVLDEVIQTECSVAAVIALLYSFCLSGSPGSPA